MIDELRRRPGAPAQARRSTSTRCWRCARRSSAAACSCSAYFGQHGDRRAATATPAWRRRESWDGTVAAQKLLSTVCGCSASAASGSAPGRSSTSCSASSTDKVAQYRPRRAERLRHRHRAVRGRVARRGPPAAGAGAAGGRGRLRHAGAHRGQRRRCCAASATVHAAPRARAAARPGPRPAARRAAAAELPAGGRAGLRAAARLAGGHGQGAGRARVRDLPRRDAAGDRHRAARRRWPSWARISGVGETKLARYGQAVLDTLAESPPRARPRRGQAGGPQAGRHHPGRLTTPDRHDSPTGNGTRRGETRLTVGGTRLAVRRGSGCPSGRTAPGPPRPRPSRRRPPPPPGLTPSPAGRRTRSSVHRVAVAAGGHLAHDRVADPHRLTAQRDRPRDRPGSGTAAAAPAPATPSRPDEAATPPHGEAQAGLGGGRLRTDVGPPHPVALLQPQALDRPVPARAWRPCATSASHSAAPYSVGQYSSQPSSPTKVTRSARTGTSPTGRRPPRQTGRPRSDSDAGVSGASSVPRRGPHSPKHAQAPVTSAIRTSAPVSRAWRRSQPRSCDPNAVPVTTQERVGGQPRHGDVHLDAAALVQRLRVDDRAGGRADVPGADPRAERRRVRPDDLDLGEGRLVEQRPRARGPPGAPARRTATSAAPPSPAAAAPRRPGVA